MTRMCDLSPKLVGEKILAKVPVTSLRAVRSTCKLWNALTKNWILGKATAREQFLGFMTMNSKVYSVRFHLRNDLVDLSIKQVDILNQVEISKVFHCDGLLLCVAKDNSRLVVWNPYLRQTRWIRPMTNFHRLDRYALGYDNNRNHKVLRFLDDYLVPKKHLFGFEIYDVSSNSWRVLDITPEWDIEFYHRGVSLKGNTYFFAQEKIRDGGGCLEITELEDFLICFDFTRERFGPRLPLPFHSCIQETVTLSCVREEQLAVLHQKFETLEIWVTTKIEPNAVSWSKFLKVDMRPLKAVDVEFYYQAGSFFIDEEAKVAVVFDFDLDGYEPTETAGYNTAFIIGEDGYFKSVSLGEVLNVGKPDKFGNMRYGYCPPLVCSSSYHPSLVQINQLRKRKERDD